MAVGSGEVVRAVAAGTLGVRGDSHHPRPVEGILELGRGGVTVAATKKLIEEGRISKNESTVICITGNGLKTQEAVINKLEVPRIINPSLAEFDAIMDEKMAAAH